jgi:hypothetical protein
MVLPTSLTTVQDALVGAWGLDTCDPVDVPSWHPGNPARGQCGVTALVLQDLLGGELIIAEVLFPDGTRQGVHYWNRVGEIEIDLTREQFTDGERIGAGAVVQRAPGPPVRCAEQYYRLRTRVEHALGVAIA